MYSRSSQNPYDFRTSNNSDETRAFLPAGNITLTVLYMYIRTYEKSIATTSIASINTK